MFACCLRPHQIGWVYVTHASYFGYPCRVNVWECHFLRRPHTPFPFSSSNVCIEKDVVDLFGAFFPRERFLNVTKIMDAYEDSGNVTRHFSTFQRWSCTYIWKRSLTFVFSIIIFAIACTSRVIKGNSDIILFGNCHILKNKHQIAEVQPSIETFPCGRLVKTQPFPLWSAACSKGCIVVVSISKVSANPSPSLLLSLASDAVYVPCLSLSLPLPCLAVWERRTRLEWIVNRVGSG